MNTILYFLKKYWFDIICYIFGILCMCGCIYNLNIHISNVCG